MRTEQKKILVLSLLAKMAICLLVPLVNDEYYYWFWGQNLQWSYFDHPPMVGWIMAIGNYFKPLADGAIRWPFAILSHGTIVIWLLLTKNLLNEKQQNWFLWILLLNPMTGWGGITGVPDVPLLFFWSLAILFSQRLLSAPGSTNYFLLGATLGLGFLSKYIIVVFIFSLGYWVWRSQLWRFILSPRFFVTVVAGLLFCSPVIIWNMQNDWASFSFQWKHGTAGSVWSWRWSAEYVLGQLLIIFPVFLLPLFSKKEKSAWLVAFGAIPLLFFFVTSFFNKVEANWPIIAYPAIYALAAANINGAWIKLTKAILGFWLLALIVVTSMPMVLPHGNFLRAKIKIFEADHFQELVPEVNGREAFWANSYQMASYLNFHSDKFVCKLTKVGRPDYFSFINRCKNVPDNFSFAFEKDRSIDFSQIYPNHKVGHASFIGDYFLVVEVITP